MLNAGIPCATKDTNCMISMDENCAGMLVAPREYSYRITSAHEQDHEIGRGANS